MARSIAPANAVTPLGFVIAVPVAGSAQLVLADARGVVRKLTLDIGAGYARGVCEEVGMAVDPARLVAYVVGAGAPVAAVDLRTMRATRHRMAAPALLRGAGCPRCSPQRRAVWLGDGRLAVTGFDVRRSRTAPAGVGRAGGACGPVGEAGRGPPKTPATASSRPGAMATRAPSLTMMRCSSGIGLPAAARKRGIM